MRTEFPASYAEARAAFCAGAKAASATLHSYALPTDPDLTIDVAMLRPNASRCLVVSSGVHGVEGPLGSAIQTGWLENADDGRLPEDVGLVLIHVVNPFGYAHDRRWNEDNVDLNRNFLFGDEQFVGAADAYRRLQSLLNPKAPPSRFEPFLARAAWQVARTGFSTLKEAIAEGQYEFASGLFFGGKAASASTEIVQQNYPGWMSSAQEVTHLDLHSGLGRFGEHRFLLESGVGDEATRWFQELFGPQLVEPSHADGTSYRARGTFGLWASDQMRGKDFRFATIDFGTHGPLRVLAALRAENQMFHHAEKSTDFDWVRQEIRECFCPRDPKWRQRVVTDGVRIMNQCLNAISKTAEPRPAAPS